MVELNKIYNEPCEETLNKLPNDVIDITVTSPPYDGLREYNGYSFDLETIISQLYRTTKVGGVCVWVIGDQTINGSETGTSFRHALLFMELGWNLHDTMIYLKDNPPPIPGERYQPCFEYMFVFSKGKPKTFNPILRKRRNKHSDKRTFRTKAHTRSKDGSFKKRFTLIYDEVKRTNVFKYVVGGGNVTKDKIAYKHPAIFPEKLVRDHLLSWSNEGELVFDPFSGSATTAKVSYLLKRNFIGSEISKEYWEIGNLRLDNYMNEYTLKL